MQIDSKGKPNKQQHANAVSKAWLESPLNEKERMQMKNFIDKDEAIQNLEYDDLSSFKAAQSDVVSFMISIDERYKFIYFTKPKNNQRRLKSLQSNMATFLDLEDH